MSPLAELAVGLPKALSAAVSQVSTYFDSKRLKSEFTIPATAFVLGCLAVLMAILGPDVPRTWWNGLTGDLKLLVMALLLVLLILITELSSHLALTVRQLYSGEWPSIPWLQRVMKTPYLKERFSTEEGTDALLRTDRILLEALDALDAFKETPADKARTRTSLPVLARPVGVYHLISDADWHWQVIEGPAPAGAITTPADLLYHYTLKPINQDQPILAVEVHTLSDTRYLAADRKTIFVDFFAGDLDPGITPGLVVTLHLTAREGEPTVKTLSDLLVLDRQGDRLALSVPAADADDVMSWLARGARRSLILSSIAGAVPLRAIPVVKPQAINPGQLLRREHIAWRLPTEAEKQGLSQYATNETEIINKLYWPAQVASVSETEAPNGLPILTPALKKDTPFPKTSLKSVAQDRLDWFIYLDDKGKPQDRSAYCLKVDKKKGQREVVAISRQGEEIPADVTSAVKARLPEEGEDVRISIDWSAGFARVIDAKQERVVEIELPVQKGDRLVVAFYETTDDQKPGYREEWCYVYEVRDDCIFIAVTDVRTFHAYDQKARKITLDPFIVLPVLNKPRAAGELIAAADVDMTHKFRANDQGVVGDACRTFDEVRDHYVKRRPPTEESADPLPVYLPISKARLGETYAEDNRPLEIQKPPRNGLPNVLRGDLVKVTIEGAGRTEHLPRAFVIANNPITLTVPGAKAPVIEQLLKASDARVTLVVTHTDASVWRELTDLATRIEKEASLEVFLDALQGDSAQQYEDKAKQMLEVSQRLSQVYGWLKERPWQNDPPPVEKDHETALKCLNEYLLPSERPPKELFHLLAWKAIFRMQQKHNVAVQRRRDATRSLIERRERQAQLLLPDFAPEVRGTRLGNILAAAADYPESAYGIETAVILPRLLPLLDAKDKSVERFQNADSSLTLLLLFSFWSAVWTILGAIALLAFGGTWWMFPVVVIGGPLLWWLGKEGAEAQAFAYGEALKALFDLKRHVLASEYGFDLKGPLSPQEERKKIWKPLNLLFSVGRTEDFPPITPQVKRKEG